MRIRHGLRWCWLLALGLTGGFESLCAQEYKYEVGVALGSAYYVGEIGDRGAFGRQGASLALTLRRPLGLRWALASQLGYRRLRGESLQQRNHRPLPRGRISLLRLQRWTALPRDTFVDTLPRSWSRTSPWQGLSPHPHRTERLPHPRGEVSPHSSPRPHGQLDAPPQWYRPPRGHRSRHRLDGEPTWMGGGRHQGAR